MSPNSSIFARGRSTSASVSSSLSICRASPHPLRMFSRTKISSKWSKRTENYCSSGATKPVSQTNRHRHPPPQRSFSDDKDVSKGLIDLKVDGLIFDHVAQPREDYSASENLFIGNEHRFLFHPSHSSILAEEREELELLNNFRQKQLEMKHRQLVEELENLRTARESQNSSSAASSGTPDHSSSVDSNFKHLM